MILKSLSVKGLGSFKKKQVFIFKPSTVTIVKGRNGSGKSTFFVEALSWLFFNKFVRNIKVEDLFYRFENNREKKISVEAVFDKFSLKRERSENSSSRIFLDDKIISQEKVISLINMDEFVFFNSIIFSQGFGGFVFFKDTDKKKLIAQLSIGFLDKYFETISELVNEKRKDLDIIRMKESLIKNQILDLNLKELYKQYQEDKLNDENRQKEVRNDIEKLKLEQDVILEKLKKLKIEKKELDNNLVKLSNEIDGLQKEVNRNQSSINILENNLERLYKWKNIFIEKQKCPMCYSIIKDITFIEKEIVEKQTSKKKLIVQLEKIMEQLQKRKNKENELQQSIEKISDLISEFQSEFTLKNEKLILLKEQLKKNTSDYEILYKQAKGKKKEYNLILENLNTKKYQNLDFLKIYEFWNLKLREYKNKIFNSIIAPIEPLTNTYLDYISDGKFTIKVDAKLKVTQQRVLDKFTIDVIQDNTVVDFNRLSGGEKRQVSLAVNISLIQLLHQFFSTDMNILIFDEIFDNLDDFAKEKVVEVLDLLRQKTNKSIIMITHDDYNVDRRGFNQIEVVSKDNISFLQEENHERNYN